MRLNNAVSLIMNRNKILIVILCWISSLTIVAIISSRFATNEVKKHYDPYTVEEIIDMGTGWKFTIANQYLDGGSWDLGFVNENGLFIFLRINYFIGEEYAYREFYLSKSLRPDRDLIEVVRGSDLENKLINLIENSKDLNTDECKVLPDKSAVVALLKSRDIQINLDNPES